MQNDENITKASKQTCNGIFFRQLGESDRNKIESIIEVMQKRLDIFLGGAVKASIILNGGASLALLAFFGQLFRTDKGLISVKLLYSLFSFGLGCAAIAICVVFIYFVAYIQIYRYDLFRSNKICLKDRDSCLVVIFDRISMVTCIASAVFFIAGIFLFYYGLA